MPICGLSGLEFDDSGWNSATSIFRFGKEKNRAHEGRGPLLQGTLGEGLWDNLLLNVVSCPFSLPVFLRPAFCLLSSWPVFLRLSFWQASFSGLSLPELSSPASWPLSFLLWACHRRRRLERMAPAGAWGVVGARESTWVPARCLPEWARPILLPLLLLRNPLLATRCKRRYRRIPLLHRVRREWDR